MRTPKRQLAHVSFLCFWCVTAAFSTEATCAAEGDDTAVALLQIKFAPTRILVRNEPATRESVDEFRVFRNTQAELIRSDFVLKAAIRRPDAARLDVVRENADLIRWLRAHLRVSFPGDCEIMEIRLGGLNKNEAAALLRAVVKEYLDHTIDVERSEQRRRLTEIEQIYNRKEVDLRTKLTNIRRLAKMLGASPDAAENTPLQQISIQRHGEDLKRLRELRLEMCRIESMRKQLQALFADDRKETEADGKDDETPADPSDVMQHEGPESFERQLQLGVLKDQIKFLEAEVEKDREKIESIGSPSIDLELMHRDARVLRGVLESLETKRQELMIDMVAQPRIRLIQMPETGNGS